METEGIFYQYLPIAIQAIIAIGFVVGTMVVSHMLGPKRKGKIKLESWECGIESHGDARLPFSVKYFLTAILFVLFDVEIIFMYPWAVNFKDMLITQGSTIFFSMMLFLSFFFLGFLYIVKKGALKWE